MDSKVSIVSTVYNEEKSLKQLYEEILSVADTLNSKYEIIFVNDGSKDGSAEVLRDLESTDGRIKAIHFSKNLGKTSALAAAFKEAKGNLIVTIDGDLQDDPKDIPYLIRKIDEGYDLVCGWRWKRKENVFKVIVSKIFNITTSCITGVKLHDINCGIKALKRDVVYNINLYSSLHRYIPILAYLKGYKITEIKVNHRERKYGISKYGISRYFIAFLDLWRAIFKILKQNENKRNF